MEERKIIEFGNVSLTVVYEHEDGETVIKSAHLFQGELMDLLNHIDEYVESGELINTLIEVIEETN